MHLPYWICAGLTIVSAAVSFGYSLAAMVKSTPAERTMASYAFARSVALLFVVVLAAFTGVVVFVFGVAIAMVVVQAIDAGIGARLRDRQKTIGPAVLAVLNLAAAIWLILS